MEPKSALQAALLKTTVSMTLSALLVNTYAPAALAQRDLLAMGVPRLHSSAFTPVQVSVHGAKAKNFEHSPRRVKAVLQRGAYTRLNWMKPAPAVVITKPVAKPAAKPIASGLPGLKPSSVRSIGPGVLYKVYAGRTRINMLDVNMSVSPVQVRPITAASTFHGLKDVHDHARDTGALAAINANYFKGSGTPLGTLMLDGEWLSGPLYTRVALGFTDGGYARIARVAMHGILHTSIPGHETLWINNMNQPRHSGSHCVLYTRRWGESVSMPYEGTLIAVNSSGEVVDSDTKSIAIPFGGFVLADSKDSPLAALRQENGTRVSVDWNITPKEWSNVTQAVSGGPLLLKNGKIAFDLKAEKFPASWTGSQITRRTACGITADDHLLMATFEGPHTLYDVAKFFLKNGCTEAMNLDGGGSTTMVVNGNTVTRNANDSQRRVAVALGLFSAERSQNMASANSFGGYTGTGYRPQADISSLLPVQQSEKSLQPDSQSTREAIEQIKALVPSSSAVLNDPQVVVNELALKVSREPIKATEEVAPTPETAISESPALGQLTTPETTASSASVKGKENRSIASKSVTPKNNANSNKSAKLKTGLGSFLFKGIGH